MNSVLARVRASVCAIISVLGNLGEADLRRTSAASGVAQLAIFIADSGESFELHPTFVRRLGFRQGPVHSTERHSTQDGVVRMIALIRDESAHPATTFIFVEGSAEGTHWYVADSEGTPVQAFAKRDIHSPLIDEPVERTRLGFAREV